MKLLLAWMLLTTPAWGIVVKDDPASHEVLYPSIVRIGAGSGVLVSPRHVLTANHCVGNTAGVLFLDGTWCTTLSITEHPTADAAICEIPDCGLSGYGLYTAQDEQGQVGIIAGYGVSGSGAPDPMYPQGVLRAATNRIDLASGYYLVMDFDRSQGGGGTEDEGMPAQGDSGGPLFLDGLLAGIHLYLSDRGDGICPNYDDGAYDLRVSAIADWITATIPEPGALLILMCGMGLLALKHKRKEE